MTLMESFCHSMLSFTHPHMVPNPYAVIFLWNTKGEILKNLHAALGHMTVHSDHVCQVLKKGPKQSVSISLMEDFSAVFKQLNIKAPFKLLPNPFFHLICSLSGKVSEFSIPGYGDLWEYFDICIVSL